MEQATFTILATDEASNDGRCSRCRSQIEPGASFSVAQWNGVEFWYCRGCVAGDY